MPSWGELFRNATRSAVHLEMRDIYVPDDPVYLDWRAQAKDNPGLPFHDWYPEERFQRWHDLVKETMARGVWVRRARIVSEPVTDYIRFEYHVATEMNVPAGEEVRWLPRRRASDLALPGNDFWVFDDRLVRLNHFSGEGDVLEGEVSDDPAVVKLCASAFETVWERAIDHAAYRIR
ncbi:MAG: hypothetical protein GEU94_06175 [Micromonosporaceae bacterium]|nr:hypothetical protein [Micromonosporaceae bacterium]